MVTNSIFHDNASTGSGPIWFRPLGGTQAVWNNVFFGNTGSPNASVSVDSGTDFQNNIAQANGSYVFVEDSSTAEFNDYFDNGSDNVLYSDHGSETYSLESNARFTDPAAGDFTLDPGFSPCIDAGNPMSGYNDVDGTRNDMGAYGGPAGSW